MQSAAIGGTTAYSYYVPSACAAGGCPLMLLLHGFGGDYRAMLGAIGGSGGAWVRALTHGPAEDPATLVDPWRYADPAGWVARDPIEMVFVAPHGRTLPGGHGPLAELDGFWTDWNPRYAAGSPEAAYQTPPPRFSTFLVDELIPSVEARFAAGGSRERRAIAGVSLGGFGAYSNALQRPHVWASAGSVSGAHNFLLAPWLDPVDAETPQGPPGPAMSGIRIPGVLSRLLPLDRIPSQAQGFLVSFYAFGDPAADNAFYRGRMPRDLAMNGRASAGGVPSLHLRSFVNDSIPRRVEDFLNVAGYVGAQAFEALVLPMNLEMQAAFETQAVAAEFEIHPGIHSGVYWNPFLRAQLEAQYARMRHRDGGGVSPPAAQTFDYRSPAASFEVWGWRFAVERTASEFLTLRDVSCAGLTLRGSGVVTVTVPASCGTGAGGAATFAVDLGPSTPLDDPASAGSLPAYGRTEHVTLSPL